MGTTTISMVKNSQWSQGSLNYMNMPSTGTYVTAREIEFRFDNGKRTVEFDVTGAVQKWVNGEISNEGFMITTRALEDSSEARFYSSDWGNHLEGPVLEFEYEK